MDKVHGGTPKGSGSICRTCRNAHLIKGINFQEIIYCRAAGDQAQQIYFPVEECSVYDDKRVPSLSKMEDIAWNIHSRSRGPIGFAGDSNLQIVIEPPNRNQPGIGPEPRDDKESTCSHIKNESCMN